VAYLPPVSTTLSANFAFGTAGVNAHGGKFAAIVSDTNGKKLEHCQAAYMLK
jgi:hypothetical protein